MNFRCFVAGQSQSVHRAVLPLGVSVRVRAGRVRGDVGGAHDDRPSLLLLGARSPLLSALDVLDSLKLEEIYESSISVCVSSAETHNAENSQSSKGEILNHRARENTNMWSAEPAEHPGGCSQGGNTPSSCGKNTITTFVSVLRMPAHPWQKGVWTTGPRGLHQRCPKPSRMWGRRQNCQQGNQRVDFGDYFQHSRGVVRFSEHLNDPKSCKPTMRISTSFLSAHYGATRGRHTPLQLHPADTEFELNPLRSRKSFGAFTCTIVSRFCLDVDMVLV